MKSITLLSYFSTNIKNRLKVLLSRPNSYNLTLVKAEESNYSNGLERELIQQLEKIDAQIKATNQELLKAQSVNLRSYVSSRESLWGNLQRNMHRNAAQESITWHWKQLKKLIRVRLYTQEKLDRITGKYWPKKIRLYVNLICLAMLIFFLIGIILMGIMTAIYLLPIWGSLALIYFLSKKKRF